MKNSDMPAMPIVDELSNDEIEIFHGLTKREHFAGLAMQGFAASSEMMMNEVVADLSVQWADALLAELDKDNGNG